MMSNKVVSVWVDFSDNCKGFDRYICVGCWLLISVFVVKSLVCVGFGCSGSFNC